MEDTTPFLVWAQPTSLTAAPHRSPGWPWRPGLWGERATLPSDGQNSLFSLLMLLACSGPPHFTDLEIQLREGANLPPVPQEIAVPAPAGVPDLPGVKQAVGSGKQTETAPKQIQTLRKPSDHELVKEVTCRVTFAPGPCLSSCCYILFLMD